MLSSLSFSFCVDFFRILSLPLSISSSFCSSLFLFVLISQLTINLFSFLFVIPV